jgi:DNA-binding PadR family transcriptional regulator
MKQPWPSAKEAAILAILRDSPKGLYGLEILQASKGTVSRGTLYVTLGRMIDKRFLEARTSQLPKDYPGLPRPLYRLTGLGKTVVDSIDFKRLGASEMPA